MILGCKLMSSLRVDEAMAPRTVLNTSSDGRSRTARGRTRPTVRTWRRRLLRVGGPLVAGLAAASSIFSIGLFPPSATPKRLAYSIANTQLYVGGREPLSNSHDVQNLGLYSLRAQALGDIMTSPRLREYIARAARISVSELAVDGPIADNLQRTEQEPTGEKRAAQIVVENVPYRLTLNDDPAASVLGVTAQAPTVAGATALADAAGAGLQKFLVRSENSARLPQSARIFIGQLAPAAASAVSPTALIEVAGFTFVVVLILWSGLVMAASRLVENIQVVKWVDSIRPLATTSGRSSSWD